MNHQTLHEEALKRLKDFATATTRLLEILEQIDSTESYRKLGYSSLWSYVTVGLKLSESQAQQFISVMRKSVQIPALKTAVATGEISLPKAALIVSEISHHNQQEWLEKASTLTTRSLKIEIAKENPKAIPQERITIRTEEISELKVGLKQEVIDKLKHVQDLLSQKKHENVKMDTTLEELADFFLERHDPVKKAARSLNCTSISKKQSLCANKVKVEELKPGRVTLPAWVRHQVLARSKGQCMAQLPNGQRCESKRFLEMHHVKPLSRGGSNNPDNLTMLCYGHHKGQHL